MTANLGSVPKNTGQGVGSSKANVIRNNSLGDNPQNPGINIKPGKAQADTQSTMSGNSTTNVPASIAAAKNIDANNYLKLQK